MARNLLIITRLQAGLTIIGSPQVVYNYYTSNKTFINTAYYKIKKQCKDNKVFINLKNPRQKEHFQQLIAPFNINKTIQHIYRQRTPNYTPILYSIDVNFNITIPNFAGAVNISGTSNYTKAQNEANREGANNNGQGGAGNNNKDNNNREGANNNGQDGAGNNNEDYNNREDVSGIRI